MKVVTYERTAKRSEELLPMKAPGKFFIQLSREQRLVIERGDTVLKVSEVLARVFAMKRLPAQKLAAYYFALGERRAEAKDKGTSWSNRELSSACQRKFRG